MEDSIFIKRVLDDFRDINNDFNHISRMGDLFSVWFSEKIILYDNDREKALEYFIGGSGDERLDIGVADEDHELVILAQSKFPDGDQLIEDQETVTLNQYNKDLIDSILSALSRLEDSSDSGNDKRKEFLTSFKERLEPDNSNLKLVVVGFGNFTPDAIEYAIKKNVDIYDFKRIKQEYIRKNSAERSFRIPERLKLNCKNGSASYDGGRFKTFSFLISTDDIGQAVEDHEEGLFIENLRYKLEGASQNKIAFDIEKTILNSPEKLTIFNNGLTIVCKKLNPVSDNLIELNEPLIVNGCQTSWAIYNAYKKKRELSQSLNAYIYARIIETLDPSSVKDVTNATNNQNPITARDKHSMDEEQKGINQAFGEFNPKILYDYRAGLKNSLERTGRIQSFFIRTIRGKPKPRVMDNALAGQLYLALLGTPVVAKTNKKDIFEVPEIYKTIFCYNLPAIERFNNSKLGIRSQEVSLRSGKIEYFLEDVFFAFAILKLTRAYIALYKEKIDTYSEEEKTKQAYKMLIDDFSFIKRWDFTVVATVNHLVNVLSKGDDDKMKKLRNALIKGNDLDNLWRSKLEEKFNLESNKDTADIVKEEAPSPEYFIFAKWVSSIGFLLYELVKKKKEEEKEAFNMREFIELSPETYRKLKAKIEEKLALPSQEKDKWFPIKV